MSISDTARVSGCVCVWLASGAIRFTKFCDDGDVGAGGDGSLTHKAMYWTAFWR